MPILKLPQVLQVSVIEPKSNIWLLKSIVDDAFNDYSSNPTFLKKPDCLLLPVKNLLKEICNPLEE